MAGMPPTHPPSAIMGGPPPPPTMQMPPNPMAMFANYPLKDIAYPHPHDVLCGRGGATNNHIGNSHWRQLVSANKELYLKLPKRQKQLLSKSIVHAVRSQNPPGRFLQKHPQTDLWYDVGDNRALEKTSQALREGAPKLKQKLKKTPEEGPAPAPAPADASTVASASSAQPSDNSAPPLAAATSQSSVGTNSSKKLLKTSLAAQTTADSVAASVGAVSVGAASVGAASLGAASAASSVATVATQRQNNLPPPTINSFDQGVPLPQHQLPQQHLPPQQQQMLAQQQAAQFAGHYPPTAQAQAYPQAQPGMYVGPPAVPPTILPQGPVPERRKKGKTLPLPAASQSVDDDTEPLPAPEVQNRSPSQEVLYNRQGEQSTGPQAPQQFPAHYADEDDANAAEPPAAFDGLRDCSLGTVSVPAPPDGGLMDHQGFSFGTVMSVDTQHIEAGAAAAASEPPMPLQANGEFSMGSIMLTDQELALLASASSDDANKTNGSKVTQNQESAKQSDGAPRHVTFNSATKSGKSTGDDEDDGNPLPLDGNEELPAPVDLGLEPAGLSAGSMMSMGTIISAAAKLEHGGLSFGSVMSFASAAINGDGAIPAAVDGGLEDIGASFGSMTLATNAGAPPAHPPPAPAAPAEAPVWGTPLLPTTLNAQQSKGNLLACSDTESEDEEDSQRISAQKSADWEKLKATFEQQMRNGGGASVPPVLTHGPSAASNASSARGNSAPNMMLHIPTTNFGRDVSQMSAMSAGDDDQAVSTMGGNRFHPPEQDPYYVVPGRQATSHSGADGSFHEMPPPDSSFQGGGAMPPPPAVLQKQESDDWADYEKTMLNRGNSLASEEFLVPQQKGGGLLD